MQLILAAISSGGLIGAANLIYILAGLNPWLLVLLLVVVSLAGAAALVYAIAQLRKIKSGVGQFARLAAARALAWPGLVEEGRRVCGQLSPACRCAIKGMVRCGIVRVLPERERVFVVMETCSSKRAAPNQRLQADRLRRGRGARFASISWFEAVERGVSRRRLKRGPLASALSCMFRFRKKERERWLRQQFQI